MDWLDSAAIVPVGGPTNARSPGARPGSTPARPLDAIALDLHAARRDGRRGIVLAGGEPTLRTDLRRVLALVGGMGFGLGVVTNGRALVYPRIRRILRAEEVYFVRVALHGADATAHDVAVGVPGAFEQTFAGLRATADEGPAGLHVQVACVVTSHNLDRLGELVDAVARLPRVAALAIHFAAPARADRTWAPTGRAAERVGVALERAAEREIEASWEGFPPCLLDRHAALRDERLRLGLPSYGPPEAGRDLLREAANDRRHPFPCQDCLHLSTCPGAAAVVLEREGEQVLRPTRTVRANSFNFEHVRDLPGFRITAGDCSARKLPFALGTARSLLLAAGADTPTGERVALYESPTGDFTEAELRQAKDELEQVYIDTSPRAVLTDFLTNVRRARSHPECRRCPRRDACGGAFLIDPAPPFDTEEALVRGVVGGLRGRVLDVGCGEQPYRAELAELIDDQRIDYHGLDPDPRSLDRFREASVGGTLHLGTIESFDGESESFDHVLVFRSLNHFRDMELAFARIVGLLRPGGTVSLCDNVVFGMLRTTAQVSYADAHARHGHEHFRNWTSHQLIDFLARLPLRVIAHHPVTAESSGQWLVRALRRQ